MCERGYCVLDLKQLDLHCMICILHYRCHGYKEHTTQMEHHFDCIWDELNVRRHSLYKACFTPHAYSKLCKLNAMTLTKELGYYIEFFL